MTRNFPNQKIGSTFSQSAPLGLLKTGLGFPNICDGTVCTWSLNPPKPGISAIMFEENPSNLFFYLLVDDLPIFLDETIHYGFQRYDYIIQLGWLTAKNDQKIYPKFKIKCSPFRAMIPLTIHYWWGEVCQWRESKRLPRNRIPIISWFETTICVGSTQQLEAKTPILHPHVCCLSQPARSSASDSLKKIYGGFRCNGGTPIMI